MMLYIRSNNSFLETLVRDAYYEFVASFLVQRDLYVFEENIHNFANDIDITKVSHAVETYHIGRRMDGLPRDDQEKRLWLLAHFIALMRAKPGESVHSTELQALYDQLSEASSQIRVSFAPLGEGASGESHDALPRYVRDELGSLVDSDGISDLLARFTSYVCVSPCPFTSTFFRFSMTSANLNQKPSRRHRTRHRGCKSTRRLYAHSHSIIPVSCR